MTRQQIAGFSSRVDPLPFARTPLWDYMGNPWAHLERGRVRGAELARGFADVGPLNEAVVDPLSNECLAIAALQTAPRNQV